MAVDAEDVSWFLTRLAGSKLTKKLAHTRSFNFRALPRPSMTMSCPHWFLTTKSRSQFLFPGAIVKPQARMHSSRIGIRLQHQRTHRLPLGSTRHACEHRSGTSSAKPLNSSTLEKDSHRILFKSGACTSFNPPPSPDLSPWPLALGF
jgi:hypothetical protein